MILSILLGYIPAFVYAGFVYWLDRYEKEPLPLLGGVFMWGALVAAAGAILANTAFGAGIFSLTGAASRAGFDFGEPQPPEIAPRQQFADGHEPDLAAMPARQLEPGIGIEIAKLDGIEPAHQLSSASGIRV